MIFGGPTPQQVLQQYSAVVGKPPLLEEAYFGHHQCRFGYKNIAEIKEMVRGYEDNALPLDGIWFDIDHMDSYQDFTLDPKNYPLDLVNDFVGQQHKRGRLIIPIIDPGIKINETLSSFIDGIEMNVFVTLGTSSSEV